MRFVSSRKSAKTANFARKSTSQTNERSLIEPLEQRQLLSAAVSTGTLTGLITDSSGNPLAGAKVRIVTAYTSGHSYFATTDSNGDYVINKVADQSYVVKARDTGYIPNGSGVFQVIPGSNTAPTVELTPIATGTVTGQVTDSNGNPIADAKVQLIPTLGTPRTMDSLPPSGETSTLQTNFADAGGYGLTATTDANGDYVINNVLDASYYVRAHISGYTPNTTTAFTVTTGSNTAPTVQLFAIAYGTVSGEVTDASGNPLSGASVELEPVSMVGETITYGPKHYTVKATDAKGDYSFSNILAGTYLVSIQAKGYVDNTSANFTVVAGSNTAPTVQLTPIVYGTVTGQITDNTGKPLAGATVIISSVSIPSQPNLFVGPQATTDANGDYTVKNVETGSYTVVALDKDYVLNRSASFTVSSGTNTAPTVALTPVVPDTVTGRITDA